MSDLISRQDAIDAIFPICENCEYFKNEALRRTIENLPSAKCDTCIWDERKPHDNFYRDCPMGIEVEQYEIIEQRKKQ